MGLWKLSVDGGFFHKWKIFFFILQAFSYVKNSLSFLIITVTSYVYWVSIRFRKIHCEYLFENKNPQKSTLTLLEKGHTKYVAGWLNMVRCGKGIIFAAKVLKELHPT